MNISSDKICKHSNYCNYNKQNKNRIIRIAKEKGLKIYSICRTNLSYADKNFVYAGPETFVSLVKHASCVVSNSFHGTAFAMIFGIPFKVLDRPDGLNLRMHDLLERKKDMCKFV